jgi:gamma-glutamyl hercynylcysteine S-oxide synthase
MPAAQPDLALRHDLLERLSDARTRTDELFGIVRRESLYERPIPERHRIVFYIGHLEAFDWNLMRDRLLDEKPFEPTLDKLFAFGIDPVGGGLPADQPRDWPSLDAVNKYVSRIRETIDARLPELLQANARRREFSPMQLLNVAIEHRLMHAETLAYMLHQLPLDKKIPQARRPELITAPITPNTMAIPAGRATLGLARDEGVFGWDNEFERHTVDVPGFAIDQYKVTNREFLNFVNAGGYESRALWSDAAWAWKNENSISHPVFWKRAGDAWQYRTMFHEIPLPLDWPVYVSHAEANAYARWAGKTLATEAQWHRAAYASERGERQYPWGDEQPTPRRGNFDFQSWDPAPVAASAAGQSAFGVRDLLGNGWEWTSTLFAPFPGFERFSFYPGYSADFFDGKHYVMKGGSPRTAACMLRRSFRNWFQPHYQYVYAGFRCVTN